MKRLAVTCPECGTTVTVPARALAAWAGSHSSEAKAATSRANGAQGGRPIITQDQLRERSQARNPLARPGPATIAARFEPLEASRFIARQLADLSPYLAPNKPNRRAYQRRAQQCRAAIRSLIRAGKPVAPETTVQLL